MSDSRAFLSGFLFSLLGHLALFVVVFHHHAHNPVDFGKPIVYSVSLERGKKVGGVAQAPKEKKKKTPVAPPKKVKTELAPAEKKPPVDAEVSLAEPKKEKKPKPTPKPVKKTKPKATPKPTPKPVQKKKTKPKPKPKKPTLAEIDKRLQAAVQRYTGESTNAGGKGFGGTGGGAKNGFGGGQVRPPEFFHYQKRLEYHIKAGWRWHDTSAPLKARVCFAISSEGALSQISLCGSSGDSRYDESVVRAVRKANPAPPPPPSVYDFFREVRMIFSPVE